MPIPGYKLFTDLNFSAIKLEREIARFNAVKKMSLNEFELLYKVFGLAGFNAVK